MSLSRAHPFHGGSAYCGEKVLMEEYSEKVRVQLCRIGDIGGGGGFGVDGLVKRRVIKILL